MQKQLQNPRNPSSISSSQSNTRLPKWTLATFKGDALEFPAYWELFQANVFNLTSFTDVQKLSSLQPTLEDEPATIIANMERTTRNYNTVIETWKEHFGDKYRKIEAHYRKLLAFEAKAESYQDLNDFSDKSLIEEKMSSEIYEL